MRKGYSYTSSSSPDSDEWVLAAGGTARFGVTRHSARSAMFTMLARENVTLIESQDAVLRRVVTMKRTKKHQVMDRWEKEEKQGGEREICCG